MKLLQVFMPLIYVLGLQSIVFAQIDSTQYCRLTLKGHVYDSKTFQPLEAAIIQITQINKVVSTNKAGEFSINQICKGFVRVKITYIGYKSLESNIEFKTNKHQDFRLEPIENQMEMIQVVGKINHYFSETQSISSIESKELDKVRGLNLGESLKIIPGVNAIQTGPSISKPVIQGLYGNRILMINNGIRQEGQQWGSEHAPEIDPFIANKLTVIKGAASIRYGSDALGGVILVEPKPIRKERGIEGEVNLVGMSNGQMGVASASIEQAFGHKLSGLSYRVQGTIRRAGNFQTPDYYLANTGLDEHNFSTTIQFQRQKFGIEAFYSQFDTRLGIFTGSVSATIDDLKAAIARPVPLTPSYFSYKIERPFQSVFHQIFKTKVWIRTPNLGRLELTAAQQQNERSEYGFVSFLGKTNPELYLEIISHTLDIVWQHNAYKKIAGSVGFNGITQGNVREFEFLIPNFRNYGGGVFIIEKWQHNRLTIEAGLRYDYRWLRAFMTNNTTGKIATPTYDFSNLTGSAGISYRWNENLKLSSNIATAWKAPTVNELFANGVHQSAGIFELGNPNLTSEKALNTNFSVYYTQNNISAEVNVYQNTIQNYTYLQPSANFIRTVRGSYPVFVYTQVNAVFRGVDAHIHYDLTKRIRITSKSALIFAYNHSMNDYLEQVPSNRFNHELSYNWGSVLKLKELTLSLSHLYVMKQNRLPPNTDFAPPPEAYSLVGANVGMIIPLKKQEISLHLGVSNLFNVSYRDYLNRFRYYADDLGRNFTIRMKIGF
jgi:iron complex outermembrane recepter protein